MRTTIATLTVATLMILATSAQAAPTLVNVRIEGKSETLFEGPILDRRPRRRGILGHPGTPLRRDQPPRPAEQDAGSDADGRSRPTR